MILSSRISKKIFCRRKGIQESHRKSELFSRKKMIPLAFKKFCREAGGQAFYLFKRRKKKQHFGGNVHCTSPTGCQGCWIFNCGDRKKSCAFRMQTGARLAASSSAGYLIAATEKKSARFGYNIIGRQNGWKSVTEPFRTSE